MNGETDLNRLLQGMKPIHNEGEYVFCTIVDGGKVPVDKTIMNFKEEEGWTVVLRKDIADEYGLQYTFVASWITLEVHSALEAVGLTAAFSKTLSDQGISCNVVAAFYHDHIFVPVGDTGKAMRALNELAAKSESGEASISPANP